MRILFVNLPTSPLPQLEQFIEEGKRQLELQVLPFGILYLSSYLKKHLGDSIQVQILDLDTAMGKDPGKYSNFENLIDSAARQKAATFKPDIVAYSVLFSIQQNLMDLASDVLHTYWPDALSIVGGNHASNSADTIFENPNIDYLGRGECEHSFMQFVTNLVNGTDKTVNGIYSRLHYQQSLPMPLSTPVNDLDELPYPDWELLDMEHYVTSKDGAPPPNERTCSILTTRGCPFSCTFCASHTTMGRKVKFRSIKNVMNEIQEIHDRYGVNKYIPEDDLFTANRRKVVPLLEEIQKFSKTVNGFELRFPNALSVNTLFDEVMDALINAGMSVTDIAVESGSPHVQRHIIKKNVKLDRAIEVTRYLRDRGVTARANIILGFPGETREMMRETVSYVYELGADWVDCYVAAPLCGSEMFGQFVDMGVIAETRETWANAFYSERIFDTEEISAVELKETVYALNLVANFRDNINFREGKLKRARNDFERVAKRYPFHIFAHFMVAKCDLSECNYDAAEQRFAYIRNQIETDKTAEAIYIDHSGLFPDFAELVYANRPQLLQAKAVNDIFSDIPDRSETQLTSKLDKRASTDLGASH